MKEAVARIKFHSFSLKAVGGKYLYSLMSPCYKLKRRRMGLLGRVEKKLSFFIQVLRSVSTFTLALSPKFQKTDVSNMTSHGELRHFVGRESMMRQPTTKPSLEPE